VKSVTIPIIFFDGDCALCNRIVQFILNHEKNQQLYFSPLNSEFALKFFEENLAGDINPNTFYFYNGSILLNRSIAAIALIPYLKWYIQPFRIFRIIPICLRDRIYNWIAKRRRKWAISTCVFPEAENNKRFLHSFNHE